MSVAHRERAIQDFESKNEVMVLLVRGRQRGQEGGEL